MGSRLTESNYFYDVFEGMHKMEEKTEEKYLGDIINNKGDNAQNIAARQSKGFGIISQIINMLDELFLGHHYFEVAVILRNSLLIN